MKKLLLITGDLAAGKTTFSDLLAKRYGVPVFQKDRVKEVMTDVLGFRDRAESKALSRAAVEVMGHIFSGLAAAGGDLILEANFREAELEKLHAAAGEHGYRVLTLVLYGDGEVLHRRYLRRAREENRHPVHLTNPLEKQEDFLALVRWVHEEPVPGEKLVIDAGDFSYQSDPVLLARIDAYMERILSGKETEKE